MVYKKKNSYNFLFGGNTFELEEQLNTLLDKYDEDYKEYKKNKVLMRDATMQDNILNVYEAAGFITRFLSNLNYILNLISNRDKIKKLYNKIKKRKATFSSKKYDKINEIYEKYFFIYVLYIIILAIILFFGTYIYIFISNFFNNILSLFESSYKFVRIKFIAIILYTLFLLFSYYYGIDMVINVIFSIFAFLIDFIYIMYNKIILGKDIKKEPKPPPPKTSNFNINNLLSFSSDDDNTESDNESINNEPINNIVTNTYTETFYTNIKNMFNIDNFFSNENAEPEKDPSQDNFMQCMRRDKKEKRKFTYVKKYDDPNNAEICKIKKKEDKVYKI